MYMQGQEKMYGGLRTRTAVLEHVRRSFASQECSTEIRPEPNEATPDGMF